MTAIDPRHDVPGHIQDFAEQARAHFPGARSRYVDRKEHACGCITVWDTNGGGSRYQHACGTHRGHARNWPAQPADTRR